MYFCRLLAGVLARCVPGCLVLLAGAPIRIYDLVLNPVFSAHRKHRKTCSVVMFYTGDFPKSLAVMPYNAREIEIWGVLSSNVQSYHQSLQGTLLTMGHETA